MSNRIHGVLLVPREDDKYGMLASGPCGARPPVALRIADRWLDPHALAMSRYGDEQALVLVWDRKLTRECDRTLGSGETIHIRWALETLLIPSLKDRHQLEFLRANLAGTVILTDADGFVLEDM